MRAWLIAILDAIVEVARAVAFALAVAWGVTVALLLFTFIAVYPVFWLSIHLDCWFGGACS